MKNRNLRRGGVSILASLVLILGLFVFVPPGHAQFNQPQEPVTLVLDPGRVIIGFASATVTNSWVDTHGMLGQAAINLFVVTNAAGSVTATLEGSNDATNALSFGTYAVATSTAVTYTNTYYPTAFNVTNTYLLPGTVTTATAATAGFAGSYLAPWDYTNTGAVTPALKGVTRLGYQVQDKPRYVRLIWTTSGSLTNLTAAATITGRKANWP